MELTLPVFKIEAALPNFLLRGEFQPRGDILVYLNDQSYSYIRFDEVELLTLTPDYQVSGVKQSMISLNRRYLAYVAVLQQDGSEKIENIQVLQTKRPAVFYTEWCAIRGDVHVNQDSRDDDLFGDGRDFYAVSNASIYPLKPVTVNPARQVPYVLVNRHVINAYHVHKPQGE